MSKRDYVAATERAAALRSKPSLQKQAQKATPYDPKY